MRKDNLQGPVWTKLDLSHLQVIRCTALVHNPKKICKKLDDHNRNCILIKYGGFNIYRLWNPKKASVIQAQDIIFNEGFKYIPSIIPREQVVVFEPPLTTHSQSL